jgi:hypothetical protein
MPESWWLTATLTPSTSLHPQTPTRTTRFCARNLESPVWLKSPCKLDWSRIGSTNRVMRFCLHRARSSQECQEMVTAFENAKLPLMVAYYRRHLPKFELVRTIIQGGQVGK